MLFARTRSLACGHARSTHVLDSDRDATALGTCYSTQQAPVACATALNNNAATALNNNAATALNKHMLQQQCCSMCYSAQQQCCYSTQQQCCSMQHTCYSTRNVDKLAGWACVRADIWLMRCCSQTLAPTCTSMCTQTQHTCWTCIRVAQHMD